MTTTLQSHGGGAQPASIDTSGKVTGGTALRVYGFDTPEAARAAGYVCEGGPAMSVALITDAQLASGAWKAEGDPSATVVYTAPSSMPVEGGYAVPVYAVNGWGSAPAPSGPTPLLDLEADMLSLSDGDPVSTWADQSGNGNDFTQSGTARPTKQTVSGYSAVVFDGVDDWMLGPNFADNLPDFCVFAVFQNGALGKGYIITKILSTGDDAGWVVRSASFIAEDAGDNNDVSFSVVPSFTGKHITTSVINLDHTLANLFFDGSDASTSDVSFGTLTSFSNAQPVRLNRHGINMSSALDLTLYAVRIYAPAPNATQRAAIEAELATRYGITL